LVPDVAAVRPLIRATHSPAALAVKGRAVKAPGKPEWWSTDDGHADPYERFAAQVIDGLIAAAALS